MSETITSQITDPGELDVTSTPAERTRSQTRQLLRTTLSYRRTQIGIALVIVIMAVAFVGPMLPLQSPNVLAGIPFSPPSGSHLLGTDWLGRDVLSRVFHGGVSVLVLSFLATIVGVAAGALLGVTAGYFGGRLDALIMRTTDLFLAFPQLVFVLLLLSAFGSSLALITLSVAITHAPRVTRVARGATVEVRENNYIQSAEALGVPHWRIILGEVFPVISSPLLAEFGLRLTWSVGLVASIGFLGLGLQPPSSDWGLMINENRIGISTQPWAVLVPVILIAILTIGANLITDGLSRALIGIDRKED